MRLLSMTLVRPEPDGGKDLQAQVLFPEIVTIYGLMAFPIGLSCGGATVRSQNGPPTENNGAVWGNLDD
jgi:hypothetical protein